MSTAGRVESIGERGGRRRKRRELTEEQKQEITEAFALFDADKDQALDYDELKVCFIRDDVPIRTWVALYIWVVVIYLPRWQYGHLDLMSRKQTFKKL